MVIFLMRTLQRRVKGKCDDVGDILRSVFGFKGRLLVISVKKKKRGGRISVPVNLRCLTLSHVNVSNVFFLTSLNIKNCDSFFKVCQIVYFHYWK